MVLMDGNPKYSLKDRIKAQNMKWREEKIADFFKDNYLVKLTVKRFGMIFMRKD